mgnify:CR=1 FL=1
MAQRTRPRDSTSQRLTFAHTACLCLGLALILWGLAPAAIERIVTGRAPDIHYLLAGSTTMTVGAAFIGLHWLIRRNVRWALWLAFLAASALTAGACAISFIYSPRGVSVFPLIFAGWTMLTSWLALAQQRREGSR